MSYELVHIFLLDSTGFAISDVSAKMAVSSAKSDRVRRALYVRLFDFFHDSL